MAMTAPAVGAGRGPWIASAALAVAIVVAAGLAVLTLVSAPSSTASQSEAVAPAPAAAAPASPAAVPPPAGAPATADTAGRALPAAVATGTGELYTALGAGDLPAVQARYRPSVAFDAAPWARVAPLLAEPANREALLAALREPPQRRSGIYRYTAGGAVVGVDAQGRMGFLLLP